MWTVKLSKAARAAYDILPGKHQRQVGNALDRLSQNPHLGKTLKGDLKGYWSYRVGVCRIIYVIRHQEIVVEVLRVQHRKEVYEKFRG